jgi:hypothetical protein
MANPTLHPVPDEDVADGSPTPEGGRARVPLGRLLVAEGLLTEAQVDDALFEGGQTGERLGEIVVRRGLLSEDEIAKVLAEQWSLSYVDRASIWFDGDALARLSREDAQRLEAMPTRVQDGRVVVAVAEPTDERLAALRQVIGEDTVVVVVPRSALDAGLSSELLASRGVLSQSPEDIVPDIAPLPPLDLVPPTLHEPEEGSEPAEQFPSYEPAPTDHGAGYEPAPADQVTGYEPFHVESPAPQHDSGSDDLEWFRNRVERLEAELAKQRAVTVEVQLHLQAALRTLLLNDVGRLDDHSNGGGPTA